MVFSSFQKEYKCQRKIQDYNLFKVEKKSLYYAYDSVDFFTNVAGNA